MIGSLKKRFVVMALAAVLVAGAVVVAAPLLLSGDRARDALRTQLTEATGQPVRMSGQPSVTLRPFLGVTYRNVEVGPTGDPLLVADEMRVRLGLLPTLFGEARATAITLLRPRIKLTSYDVPRVYAGQESQMPDLVLRNGTLELSMPDGASRKFGSLDGTLSWPSRSSPVDIDLSANWRDERLNLNARVDNPAGYLSGENSDVSFTVRGAPGSVRFLGQVQGRSEADAPLEAQGRFSMTLASTSALGRWLSLDDALPNFTLAVDGDATIRGQGMLLDNANVGINDQQASGRLDIATMAGGPLKIGGTLAFPSLDLQPLETGPQGLGDGFARLATQKRVALDLRISAETVTAPPLTINGAAGGLIVGKQEMQLDLAQGTIGDANLSGTIASSGRALNADLAYGPGALANLAPLLDGAALRPAGNGTAQIDVFSERRESGDTQSRITVAVEGGALEGFDIDTLAGLSERSATEMPFDGTTQFDSLSATVFVREGAFVVREATLNGPAGALELSGNGTLTRRTLALRGVVTTEDAGSLPFFVGGTTAAPLAVPMPRSELPLDETPAATITQ